MRVGLVIGSNQFGGAERQAQQLALALQRRGLTVHVFSMDRPRRGKRRLDFGDVPVTHLWYGRGRSRLSRLLLRILVRLHGIDVLQLYNVHTMELAESISRVRRIGSVRGILFNVHRATRDRLRRAATHMDVITCNCRSTARLLIEHDICTQEQVRVIPNAVQPVRTSPRRSDGALSVMFCGTLKDVKDPSTFVEGVSHAAQESSLRAVLVGDGPLRSHLEHQVASRGLGDIVRFLGAVSPADVPYGQADLFVSTSLREGSSNSILESMAAGLPVIATAVGGSVEILEESGGGILIPPGDASALAEAILALAKDTELRSRLGRSGQSYVRSHHDPDRATEMHLHLYRDAMQGASK